jgi:hypothetical protein
MALVCMEVHTLVCKVVAHTVEDMLVCMALVRIVVHTEVGIVEDNR